MESRVGIAWVNNEPVFWKTVQLLQGGNSIHSLKLTYDNVRNMIRSNRYYELLTATKNVNIVSINHKLFIPVLEGVVVFSYDEGCKGTVRFISHSWYVDIDFNNL